MSVRHIGCACPPLQYIKIVLCLLTAVCHILCCACPPLQYIKIVLFLLTHLRTILFGDEKAMVAGYCMISGFSRNTDSMRDRVCFTKICTKLLERRKLQWLAIVQFPGYVAHCYAVSRHNTSFMYCRAHSGELAQHNFGPFI